MPYVNLKLTIAVWLHLKPQTPARSSYLQIIALRFTSTSRLYQHSNLRVILSMSLFGTSPENSPSRNVKSSLFDDEAPARQGGSGLFADDPPDNANDSPWGFPTPRRQARGNPVKTLLSGANVPESYIDAYDALLENGESAGNGVSLAGIRRLLAASAISTAQQQEIMKIVLPQGDVVDGLGRSEFNVVLALIGLAQEGEEVSLDGVDERKRSRHLIKISLTSSSRYTRTTADASSTTKSSTTFASAESASTTCHTFRISRSSTFTTPVTTFIQLQR